MEQITKQMRRESYEAVLPKRNKRCRLILDTLGDRQMTASEIPDALVASGAIPYFNRNFVAPRLTELKEIGVVETVGRRKATHSNATEAVWAKVRQLENAAEEAGAEAGAPATPDGYECSDLHRYLSEETAARVKEKVGEEKYEQLTLLAAAT